MIKRGELSAPISVLLNVTNRCNLRCRHCSASAGHPLDDELTTSEWLALIQRLAELKVFLVIVTGGEPLIRPDIYQLLEALERGHMSVQLNTNATLMDEEVAQRLAGFKFLKVVNVSLDGSCAAIHDQLRGPGAFDRAIGGIEALLRHGIPVNLGAVVTKLNMDDLAELVRLAKALGVQGIGFSSLHPTGRTLSNMDGLWLSGEERKVCAQRLTELQSTHNGFVNASMLSWLQLLSAPPRVGDRPRSIHPCSAGVDSCAVAADGSVLACNSAPDYVCGNVRESDLGEIWHHSPEMLAVRALPHLTSEDVVGCQECAYRFSCSTGCRADAWALTGSWTGGPSAICWHSPAGS